MGCSSSKSADDPQAAIRRKRLSVSTVQGGEAEAKSRGAEDRSDDDRQVLEDLDSQTVVDLAVFKGSCSFSGSNTDPGKASFSDKSVIQIGMDVDLASVGIQFTCRKGLKPESPNQDSWCVFRSDLFSIYAVFDGHGQKGHDVSQFVKEKLPKLILQDPRSRSSEIGMCLMDSFSKMQEIVEAAHRLQNLDGRLSGTTATLVFHDHKNSRLTTAHVADSTAALGKNEGGKWKGVALTTDHKPNLPGERARIEKNGGRVVFDGYANHRVYARGERYPGLNMSRCIGDILGHHTCGISAVPEIGTFDLDDGNDKILLLCSDGVWEFITPQQALDVVIRNSDGGKALHCAKAADSLAKEAWDCWIKQEVHVVDDITVGLVWLPAIPQS